MKHGNALRAARNAQAIKWAKTHTLRDLEDLVDEMAGLGEDVSDIAQLLDDLCEIDRSLQTGADTVPELEASEHAITAG
ncbi:MAG: hypothetical protein JW880_00145 [Candidatus Thermoplasmatota archaeon]|nr:hypothetical protein [Candidatus Thermoplasmatota archaeon]